MTEKGVQWIRQHGRRKRIKQERKMTSKMEKKYEEWRFGKVNYLEQVCSCNLKKLSFIMKQIRSCAEKSKLQPSFCYYKQWGVKKKNGQGQKPVILLRFSKSEKTEIERAYATHYVDRERTEKIKMEKKKKVALHDGKEISVDQAARMPEADKTGEGNRQENGKEI